MTAPQRTARRSRRAVEASVRPKVTSDTESPLERHLRLALAASGLPAPQRQYRFHPTRRWRLDFAWPEQRLAVEVEGGIYRGGAHTSVSGLKRDIEKQRELTLLGWRLLRFHGDEIRSGLAVRVIRQALAAEPQRAERAAGGESE